MKVGNTTGYFWYGENADGIYGRMAEIGYEAADQSMCDIKDPIFHDDAALKKFCDDNKSAAAHHGIVINQLHGPWPTYDTEADTRAEGWRCFHRAVLACHMMEIPYMVFHPQMPYGWGNEEEPELAKKLTVDLMADLLPDCEKYGVTICHENMPFRGHRISTMHRIVEVLDILRSLHQAGNTVVLITHDNTIAAAAERVIRLEDGKVVYDGPASDPASGVHKDRGAGA
jgi:sugar phosphate isomerase/epimerase